MENHYITIENREKIIISQVADVDAFDEQILWANLKDGAMEITGEKLNIEKLDLNEGMLVVSGKICSLVYTDREHKQVGGIIGRIKNRGQR